MEESSESAISFYCWGCLCNSKEFKLQNYEIQYAPFYAIFERDTIKLCFLCKRMAQHAELFIQNAQNNKILLETSLEGLSTTIKKVRSQLRLPITLTHTYKNNLVKIGNATNSNISVKPESMAIGKFLTCNERDGEQSSFNIEKKSHVASEANMTVNCAKNEYTIHYEDIKIEIDETMDCPEEELADDIGTLNDLLKEDNPLPEKSVKEETCHTESNNANKPTGSPGPSEKDVLLQPKHERRGRPKLNKAIPGIQKIYLTFDQVMEERKQLASDEKFLKSPYKCVDCLKSFNLKYGLEVHLDKHSVAMGALVCDICKIRLHKTEQMEVHRKIHFTRYKCTECGLVRITKDTMTRHVSVYHQDNTQYFCRYCNMRFKIKESLEKHVKYKHFGEGGGVTCPYCDKKAASKKSLNSHIMLAHPELSEYELAKGYACEQCGMSFKTPFNLKRHSLKHLRPADTYCEKCDKSFKTVNEFKNHMKKARPHLDDSQLQFPCPHCVMKFAKKKDLDIHVNIHLGIRPFKCDKCEKSYAAERQLRTHVQYVHEGYKRPRRHPCLFCDKIFDSKTILNKHVRTHTGERPYECGECSARFAQASTLATHGKLVHREGKEGGGGKRMKKEKTEQMHTNTS